MSEQTIQRYPDGSTVRLNGFEWTVELMGRDADALLPSQTDRGEDFNLYRLSRDKTKSIFRWQHELDEENGIFEIRGYFHITIYPDCEIWRLKYNDGTLGEAHQIDNDDTTLEVCSVCNRRWSPQDRNLAYGHDGKMTCPDCQVQV